MTPPFFLTSGIISLVIYVFLDSIATIFCYPQLQWALILETRDFLSVTGIGTPSSGLLRVSNPPAHTFLMLLSCSSSQSGVPGAATAVSAGNLLEMHILSLCPRPADGNSGGGGDPEICFSKSSR